MPYRPIYKGLSQPDQPARPARPASQTSSTSSTSKILPKILAYIKL